MAAFERILCELTSLACVWRIYSPQNAKFWVMDVNNDMSVDFKEFDTAACTQFFNDRKAAFTALDRNTNEMLDIAEFHDRPQDVPQAFGLKTQPWIRDNKIKFAMLDENNDRTIVASEVYPEDAPIEGIEKILEELKTIDTDSNGQVTFDEFKTRETNFFFPCLDTNHDGTLSPPCTIY